MKKIPVTGEWLETIDFELSLANVYERLIGKNTISVWCLEDDWCYCSVKRSLPIVVKDRDSIEMFVEALESVK